MLKNITILKGKDTYFNKDFAFAFKDPEALQQMLKMIDKELTLRGFYDEELVIDIITLKIICYKMTDPFPLLVALTYDDSSLPEQIIPKLQKLLKVIRNFLGKKKITEDNIPENINELFESQCSPLIEDLIKVRPAKISIVGFDFVGKSSICEMIQNGKIPRKYKETTLMEHHKAKLFGMPLLIWDIPDQGDISEKVWSSFILGSDAVIIVLDSTKENVMESKAMVEVTDKIIPHAELLIVANKQDSDDALKPEEIEDILGTKVFPFEANKAENSMLIQIQTAKLLEIKAEGIDYSEEDFIIQRND